MLFPFTIRYSGRFREKVKPDEVDRVLSYIKRFVADKTGEEVEIAGNQLIFRTSLFALRWSTNILAPIEKGVFNIVTLNEKTILTYEFFMYRLWIIATLMSILIGYISKELWWGLLFFAGSAGLNWIITLVRHKFMLDHLIREIENNIISKNAVVQNSN